MILNASPLQRLAMAFVLCGQLPNCQSRCAVCESHKNREPNPSNLLPANSCETNVTKDDGVWSVRDCQSIPYWLSTPSKGAFCIAAQTLNTKLWGGSGEYTFRDCVASFENELGITQAQMKILTQAGILIFENTIWDFYGVKRQAKLCICNFFDCNAKCDVSPDPNRSTTVVTPPTRPPSTATKSMTPKVTNQPTSNETNQPTNNATNQPANNGTATTIAPAPTGSNIGLIAGGIAGAVVLVAILALIACKKLSGGGDKGSVDEGGEPEEEAKVSLE